MINRIQQLCLVAVVMMTGLTHAATITTEDLAADGSNLDNSNTILWAYNFVQDKDGVSDQTINGVTFTPYEAAEAGTNTDLGLAGFDGMGANNTPISTTMGITDAALAEVMTERWQTPGSGTPSFSTITLKDLSIGAEYRLQMLGGQDSSDRGWDVEVGSDTLGVLAQKNTPGQLVTVEFTAGATTLDVILDPESGRGVLNAAALTLVPEPASLALLSLGGALVLSRRVKA